MPSTRRSVEVPVRATRSHGAVQQISSDKKDKTAGLRSTATKTKTKDVEKIVIRTLKAGDKEKQSPVEIARATRRTAAAVKPELLSPSPKPVNKKAVHPASGDVVPTEVIEIEHAKTAIAIKNVDSQKTTTTPKRAGVKRSAEQDGDGNAKKAKTVTSEASVTISQNTENKSNLSSEPEASSESKKQSETEFIESVPKFVSSKRQKVVVTERKSQLEKPVSEIASPMRRSSRTVIPSSRFKDMEMLETSKRKTVSKEKEKKIEPSKEIEYTSMTVQIQPETAENVTEEEIITEETQIDAVAQMNLFDEILILPPSQTENQPQNVETVLETCATASMTETPNISTSDITVGNIVVLETEETHLGDVSGGVASLPSQNTVNGPSFSYTENKAMVSIDTTQVMERSPKKKQPTPQVIVIPAGNSSLHHQYSKIRAKEMMDIKGHSAVLSSKSEEWKSLLKEQKFQKKEKIIVVSPEEVKQKTRRIFMSPTHTPKTVANQKVRVTSNVEQFRISEGVVHSLADSDRKGNEMSADKIETSVKPSVIVRRSGDIPVVHTPVKEGQGLQTVFVSNPGLQSKSKVEVIAIESKATTAPDLKTTSQAFKMVPSNRTVTIASDKGEPSSLHEPSAVSSDEMIQESITIYCNKGHSISHLMPIAVDHINQEFVIPSEKEHTTLPTIPTSTITLEHINQDSVPALPDKEQSTTSHEEISQVPMGEMNQESITITVEVPKIKEMEFDENNSADAAYDSAEILKSTKDESSTDTEVRYEIVEPGVVLDDKNVGGTERIISEAINVGKADDAIEIKQEHSVTIITDTTAVDNDNMVSDADNTTLVQEQMTGIDVEDVIVENAESICDDANLVIQMVPNLENTLEMCEDGNLSEGSLTQVKLLDTVSKENKKALEQQIMSTFCQVIEFDKQKDSRPQTAIEYVVFGDKMVPIHKPYTSAASHGRVQTSRPQVQPKKTHGRVEVIGQAGSASSMVKKIPLSAAQSAINSVIEQIGEDKDNTTIDLNSIEIINKPAVDTDQSDVITAADDSKSIKVEETDTIADESEISETKPRMMHGYIDQPVVTSEPTKIVEISPDIFAKEVYGEENLVLDPVTGEMVPESMLGITTSQPFTMVTGDQSDVITMVSGDQSVDTGTTVAVTISDNSQCNAVEKQDDADDHDANIAEETVDETIGQSEKISVSLPEELTDQFMTATSSVNVVRTEYDKNGALNIHIETLDTKEGSPDNPIVVVSQASGNTEIASVKDSDKTCVHNTEKNMDVKKANKSSGEIYTIQSLPSTKRLVDVKVNPAPAYTKANNFKVNPGMTYTCSKGNQFKINPAVAYTKGNTMEKSVVKSSSGTPNPTVVRTVATMATSTETQTEMETQTEYTDEESDDDDQDSKGYEEIIVVTPNQAKSGVKRTTVIADDDGKYQEYVVVHLPEGTEIKQQEGRKHVPNPIHDEVVTMSSDGMYVCMDCNHKTEKKGNWYKHRRKHLGIRPHACTRCSYKAATSSNLKRHMNIHDDVRNFPCTICGLLFRQKIHLERHVKYKHQEKKVKCPLCDYLCSSENPDLKIHIRRRHMPQEDGSMSAFTCDECGLMTVSKKDLKQHLKFHKKGPELKLFCEYCSFVTDCESRLRRHMLIHTKERPFQCGLCAYRGSQKEHVLRHMRSQHDIAVERRPRRSLLDAVKEKPRRSLLDGFDPSNLKPKASASVSSDESESDKPFEKSDYSSTDKIFACNHCSMKFSKMINLYKHLFAQHRQVMPDPAANDFQCVVCDFRTNNKKNLLVHMRKHNMQDHTPPSHVYSCVLCRYINPRRRNLFQHMKKKHGIEIVMKEDGSNCYVTSDNSSVVLGQSEGETSLMALSEIISTQTVDDDTQLQIVTDDGTEFHTDKMTMDNIISVEDMTAYVAAQQEQVIASIASSPTTIVSTSLYQPTVAEHEAAEAIEGLQALAEQAGIVEIQNMDNTMATEIVTSEVMTEGEIMTTGEETLIDQAEDAGIQLSTEQLNQLSTGDYVEINGEVYKVEIAQEGATKSE